ncbi:unnamed protein product [Dovyalis caffra]|uniref:Uncharacterized protein n=1 Tax=Dovyalis caffra TaxID=77055 RepID=A0AAV1RSE2_9ROSI|nr:unnamed protein product [Dovyalis caffra]
MLNDVHTTSVNDAEQYESYRWFGEGGMFQHMMNGSIFKVISNAITVAAKDHPEEFKLKRGEIVETERSFKDEPQGVKSRPNGNAVDLAHCKEAGCEAEALVEMIEREKELIVCNGEEMALDDDYIHSVIQELLCKEAPTLLQLRDETSKC